MKRLSRLLYPALLALATSAAADLGPLTGIVATGSDDTWTGYFEDDWYWMVNEADAGAIRYYYGPYDEAEAGQRTVSVTIDVRDAAPDGRAGLLYAFDASARSYYLIVLGPAGELDVFRRDERGFNRVMSSTLEDLRPTASLRLTEREREVTVEVDGERIASFESDGTGRGAIGLAAMGLGSFAFADYQTAAATIPQGARSPGRARSSVPPTGEWTERTLRDEFGFAQPQDAYRLMLPPDWTLKGAVQWYGQTSCPLDSTKLHFMATSPDGRERVELIPGGSWSWLSLYDAMPQLAQDSNSGCQVRRILNAQTFVNEYLPAIRPGAKLLDSRSRPDLAQKIRQSAGNMALSPGQQIDIQVLELSITYEADGQQVNETLLPSLLFSTMPGPDPYGGMSGVTLVAQALGTVAGAHVGGQVDQELLLRVGESLSMLPAYQQRLEQYYRQKTELMAAAFQRRRAAQQQWLASRRAAAASSASSAGSASAGSDILDIQFEGWKKRDAMTSAGQSRAVDGIAERQAYSNTSGQIVYMPSQYRRAYQLPNDVYVGTNDEFFNPVGQTGQFGEEMPTYDYGR